MHEGHEERGPIPAFVERIGKATLDAAFRAHRNLGPGLLESVYENCLAEELITVGMPLDQQVAVPVVYGSRKLDVGFRIDVLVNRAVVVEVKSIEAIAPVHVSQVLTYLRFSGCRLGYLVNFNSVLLKDGIRRVVL